MKMTKPEFEVIRFDAADVIATSGSISGNLLSDKIYAALTSEVAQAGYPLWSGEGEWASFRGDLADEGVYNGIEREWAAYYSENWLYAWFNNGQWHTDGQTLVSYTGVDRNTAFRDNSTYFDPSNTIWRTE